MMKKILVYFMIMVFIVLYAMPQISFAQDSAVTNDPHTGAGMLQIKTEGKQSWMTFSIALRNIDKNTEYTLSYWVKGEANVSCASRVVNSANWSNVLYNATVTANSEWTYKSFTFNSGDYTNLLFALMDNSRTAGVLYFDDFAIECSDGSYSEVSITDPGFENTLNNGTYGSVVYFDNRVTLGKSGAAVDKLEAGDLTVSLDFQNIGGNYPEVTMIAAVYKDDMCLRLSFDKAENIEKNQITTLKTGIYVSEDEVQAGAYISVMLWKSFESALPLCTGTTVIKASGIQHGLFFENQAAQTPEFYHRGVNLAGAEFNDMSLYNQEQDFKYFAEKGFDILRVPIKWERMQPVLFGPLDENEVRNLKNNADWAQKYGAQIIIDVHNYSKYGDQYIGMSDTVTMEAFNDLWKRLSDVFKDHNGVYGYDIMNEPSGMMTAEVWKKVSQSCVDAIRENGDNKLILIEGVGYSSAGGWTNNNQAARGPWIDDPIDNVMYSAHCYFDSNNSGTYSKTFDEEANGKGTQYVIDRALGRLKDFTDWCSKYGVRGHLGEFGVPNNDERWLEVLDAFLQKCDETGMDTTYWAAGRYWGTYHLSCQPTNDYTTDAVQMEILLKHLPKSQ